MAEGPGDAFAVGNDEQYQPVRAVGDQRVLVSGPEGTGPLACHASRTLGGPRRGPVVVVVLGALRDSDRYLPSAQHAARLAESEALIVAPAGPGAVPVVLPRQDANAARCPATVRVRGQPRMTPRALLPGGRHPVRF